MKLWKLKYMIEDKIKDIKDYLTDDAAVLVYRVFSLSILCGVIVYIIGKKFG